MTKLTEQDYKDLDKVEKLAGLGLTMKQIGGVFGLSVHNFESRIKKIPELREAYEMGKSKAIAYMATTLFERAKTDNTCLLFYLKCVAGWNDRQVVDHNHKVSGSVAITPETKTAEKLTSLDDTQLENHARKLALVSGTDVIDVTAESK